MSTVTWNFGQGSPVDAPQGQPVTYTYTSALVQGQPRVTATIDGEEVDALYITVPWVVPPYTIHVTLAAYAAGVWTPGQLPAVDDATVLAVADAPFPTPTFDSTWNSTHTLIDSGLMPAIQWLTVKVGALPAVTKNRSQVMGMPVSAWLGAPVPSGTSTLSVATHLNLTPPDDWGQATAQVTKA